MNFNPPLLSTFELKKAACIKFLEATDSLLCLKHEGIFGRKTAKSLMTALWGVTELYETMTLWVAIGAQAWEGIMKTNSFRKMGLILLLQYVILKLLRFNCVQD